MLRRIELICNVLNKLGKLSTLSKEVVDNVDIRFTRNTINNNEELVTRASSVEIEKERLTNEKSESLNFLSDDYDSHSHDEEVEQ